MRRRVRNLVTGSLKPSDVGLALLDGRQLRWVLDQVISDLRNAVFSVRQPDAPGDAALGRDAAGAAP